MTLLGAGMTLADPEPSRQRTPPIRPPRIGARTAVASSDATRVLGLDLAMQTTGWCMLIGGQPAAHGTFHLPDRRKGESLASWLTRRSDELGRQVELLVALHCPEVVGFETPDTYRRAWSGGTKGREFEVSLALGRVQGFLVAQWRVIGQGAELSAVTTSDAKRVATGRVDASKDQVAYHLRVTQRWDLTGWCSDEIDAAAIALAVWEGM